MTENKKANLTLQKRLAADILGCGRGRVAFVGDKEKLVAGAKSRTAIRKIIASKLIYKRDENSVSRSRVRTHTLAKRLGRHTGAGKRNGCRDARNPSKTVWIHRMRSQRKMLRKYRDEEKINKTQFHELYFKVKGNQYKNKRVLLEHIISIREEAKRAAALQQRAEETKAILEQKKVAAKVTKTKVAGK